MTSPYNQILLDQLQKEDFVYRQLQSKRQVLPASAMAQIGEGA
jgi:hypothetical protein